MTCCALLQFVVTKQIAGLYDKEGNAEKTEELQEQLRKIERDGQATGEWSQETDGTSEVVDTDSSENEEDDVSETSSSSDSGW